MENKVYAYYYSYRGYSKDSENLGVPAQPELLFKQVVKHLR
jgi:hypothetical protein